MTYSDDAYQETHLCVKSGSCSRTASSVVISTNLVCYEFDLHQFCLCFETFSEFFPAKRYIREAVIESVFT